MVRYTCSTQHAVTEPVALSKRERYVRTTLQINPPHRRKTVRQQREEFNQKRNYDWIRFPPKAYPPPNEKRQHTACDRQVFSVPTILPPKRAVFKPVVIQEKKQAIATGELTFTLSQPAFNAVFLSVLFLYLSTQVGVSFDSGALCILHCVRKSKIISFPERYLHSVNS